jgi:anthranilate phosphoribosyltransferase
LVYRGDDGIDKLTTTGHSHIWEVSRGFVTEHDLNPVDLGIPRAEISSLLGADPEHNASVARRVLAGEPGPVRDIVLLNAAAGISAFELAQDPDLNRVPILERLAGSMEQAAATVDSGRAAAKLDEWVAATNA